MEILTKSSKLFGTAVKVFCVSHCFFEYVGELVWCAGTSMEPAIESHSLLICDHISSLMESYKKGDIVIAKSVTNPKEHICKRIVGLEGDLVWNKFHYVTVPHGYVWLEGDNKTNSTDSRNYGPIPVALLRGHVLCSIWPLSFFQRSDKIT